jgi:hypothetical protein
MNFLYLRKQKKKPQRNKIFKYMYEIVKANEKNNKKTVKNLRVTKSPGIPAPG